MKTNWQLCTAVILASTLTAAAQGPKGTEARHAATSYAAHSEVSGVAVGARLLTPKEARRAFVSDINRCCTVVEVAFYPPADRPLNLSLNDFVLKIKNADVQAKPSSATVVAASLQKKAGSDRDVTVAPYYGIGYESGRGYDPVTGRQGGGVTQTGGVMVGVGQSGPNPASTDRDRSVMETELSEKGLPEGAASAPVAGYIYFPVSSKKNGARQLECKVGEEKIVLSLPQ